jgi:hypothetical protein
MCQLDTINPEHDLYLFDEWVHNDPACLPFWIKEQPMFHGTLTGYYAGTPWCNVNKLEAKTRGDRFAHLGSWIDNPHLNKCPECYDLYLSVLEE